MYAFLDANNTYVRRVADGATFAWDAEIGRPCTGTAAEQQWEADGAPVPAAYTLPPLTIDDYRRAIQAHADATAQARAYDSGITCASYIGSTNPAWAAEAQAFVAWRDAVWVYAYTELAKVEGGQRPQPTVAEIVAELPPIVWPGA